MNPVEWLQWHQFIYGDKVIHKKVVMENFLKSMKVNYKIDKIITPQEEDHIKEDWAWFTILDPIENTWSELVDMIRGHYVWTPHWNGFWGFMFYESYPILDLGDDMCGTPIEAIIASKLIHKFGHKIRPTHVVHAKRYPEMQEFLQDHIGDALYIWN